MNQFNHFFVNLYSCWERVIRTVSSSRKFIHLLSTEPEIQVQSANISVSGETCYKSIHKFSFTWCVASVNLYSHLGIMYIFKVIRLIRWSPKLFCPHCRFTPGIDSGDNIYRYVGGINKKLAKIFLNSLPKEFIPYRLNDINSQTNRRIRYTNYG